MPGHEYLSTSCFHGDMTLPDGRTGHQYCQSETGHAGSKTPAQCKFCAAKCICPCHDPASRVLHLDTLATQIAAERDIRGWSQQDLADRVGVGQQAVSGWERGGRPYTDEALARLGRALGFTHVATGHGPVHLIGTTPAPAPPRLPLTTLGRSEFVDFATEVLCGLFHGAAVDATLGRQGGGIDAYLHLPGGDRIALRCAHLRKFHPASFEKILRQTAGADADHFLLLVTTSVNDHVQSLAARTRWEIWDAPTIDAKVRSLADADAVIGQYFPQQHTAIREETDGAVRSAPVQ